MSELRNGLHFWFGMVGLIEMWMLLGEAFGAARYLSMRELSGWLILFAGLGWGRLIYICWLRPRVGSRALLLTLVFALLGTLLVGDKLSMKPLGRVVHWSVTPGMFVLSALVAHHLWRVFRCVDAKIQRPDAADHAED